jgi:hypothetical protein
MILTKFKTIDEVPTIIYSMKLDKQTFVEQNNNVSILSNKPSEAISKTFYQDGDISPISYLNIIVIAYTNDGKCAAFDKSILINGVNSTISLVGAVKDFFAEKSDIGFDCSFNTNGKELEIIVTGLIKTEVNWVVNIDKII